MKRASFYTAVSLLGAIVSAASAGACGDDDKTTATTTSTSTSSSSSSGMGGAGGTGGSVPHTPHVIYIDVDDHGLKALWDAKAPNMQKMAKEGTLAYTRVDIPTHSNQSNVTLLTGGWPETTNVPHNSWLDRNDMYKQPFAVGGIAVGDYIFYDKNPMGSRVDSIYSASTQQGIKSSFVGLLPPFEHGADDVHFTVYNSTIFGIKLTDSLIATLLTQLHYPKDYQAKLKLDGPPMANEPLNQFTLRDAADTWKAAAAGGKNPPEVMFVWDFIALDGNPTDTMGSDGPGVQKIVEAIDVGVGNLMQAVKESGWEDSVSFVLTLDHGKVNTHNQVAFETQLGDLIAMQGAAHGVTKDDYQTLDEDGDVLIYAVAPGAGTAAGSQKQMQIAHGLTELLQANSITGLDPTRTITWDGYLGTKRFYDVRSAGPNNPDIIAFPKDDWTLNDPAMTKKPGPIGSPFPYGRHGGFSTDELYVPAIFYGPAFKKGVMLPTPIDHADIAPTVMAAIGKLPPKTAQGGVVVTALASDKSGAETTTLPADPHLSRDVVLANAGYATTGNAAIALKSTAAQGVVIIDVAGLYEDAFPTGPNVVGLAQAGTRFIAMHTRYRDYPVNEYELLTGSYPVRANWLPFAEDDPKADAPPGLGQLMMPPAANFISDKTGFDAWHMGTEKFTDPTVFAAAKAAGFKTALLGTPDFHDQHIPAADLDFTMAPDLKGFFMANPKSFVLYAVDAGADAAKSADQAVAVIQGALKAAALDTSYVIVLTSRGGAAIDAKDTDAHGAGSARHVPLVIAGPNVRKGVVTGGPAIPADVAPTVLFALGVKATAPDFAYGSKLDGGMSADPTPMALPVPAMDYQGKVLWQAFEK